MTGTSPIGCLQETGNALLLRIGGKYTHVHFFYYSYIIVIFHKKIFLKNKLYKHTKKANKLDN